MYWNDSEIIFFYSFEKELQKIKYSKKVDKFFFI
jgi:hypothetical protein